MSSEWQPYGRRCAAVGNLVVDRLQQEREVYWRLYVSPSDARCCLKEFRMRYNDEKPHWALKPRGRDDVLVPSDVYVDGLVVEILS